MDDHRRASSGTGDGYASTVAVAVPVSGSNGVPVRRSADTELATGTDLRAQQVSDRTGPVIGGMIGRFQIVERIGQDPIGVVFAGRGDDGKRIAIKLVHATVAHDAWRARLVRQAPGLAALSHDSLVSPDELGVAFGRPFIVMEFVEGVLLPTWLETPRTWGQIVDVYLGIGGALVAAHEAGFGHGDWTTLCVLVEPSGRPRVIDVGFGRFDPQEPNPPDPRSVDQLRFAVSLRTVLGGGDGGEQALWQSAPQALRDAVTGAVAAATGAASSPELGTLAEVVAALAAVRKKARGATPVPVAKAAPVVAAPTVALVRRDMRVWIAAAVAAGLAFGGLAYGLATKSEPAAVSAAPAPAPALAPVPAPPVVAVVPKPIESPAPPAAAPVSPPTPIAVAPPATKPTVKASKAITKPSEVDPLISKHVAPPPLPPAAPAPPVEAPKAAPPPAPDDAVLTEPQAIQKAVLFFGYENLNLSGPAPHSLPDDAPPLEAGIAEVRLGALSRKKGDCATASVRWHEGVKKLALADDDATEANRWKMRAWLGLGLCALASGDYNGAIAPLREVGLGAENALQQREAWFGEAIAFWKTQDPNSARAALRKALAGTSDVTDPVRVGFGIVQGPLGITPR
jgi:tRNA A-37 threonylcarbamoyl transferase component Bud32